LRYSLLPDYYLAVGAFVGCSGWGSVNQNIIDDTDELEFVSLSPLGCDIVRQLFSVFDSELIASVKTINTYNGLAYPSDRVVNDTLQKYRR
jgi:hypothetical protein